MKRILTIFLLLSLALALLPTRPALAATFTVTNTNNDGAGSLRWAIEQANTNVGPDTIAFNIPGDGIHTISPLTPLPILTDGGTTIDGYTQSGAEPAGSATAATIRIAIDGSAAGSTILASGLTITSTNNTIRGLAIYSFAVDGILIFGESATGNVIAGNHLGCDPNGMIERGNGADGIYIGWGASDNLVGGDQPAARNVLSGNGWSGVDIHGSGTTGNVVSGNYIGTAASGMAALGNTLYGVRIYGGARNNAVGGDAPGERNVISGNGVNGVRVVGAGTSGNMVSGNYIGTTTLGTAAIGNAKDGVLLAAGAQQNVIGGDDEGERNLISGNLENGVNITGTTTMSNTVSGNYIGTDAGGTADLGNSGDGVRISDGAPANVIGGSTTGERNLISGNTGTGIRLLGPGTQGTMVFGNYIGTDVNGAATLGNAGGIDIFDATNNLIGGVQPGQGNLISGNQGPGVFLIDPWTTGNVIAGNRIGTDASGTLALGNTGDGVDIWQGGHDNTVGPGNVISGNGGDGILLGVDASGNTIFGNHIGTDAAGTVALANAGSGIVLDWAPNNRIGGDAAGERNVISGNTGHGIHIQGAAARGNVVVGNTIGTDANGTADLGNVSDGVYLNNGAQENRIGGTTPAERNVVSGNDRYGILIVDSGTMSNTVAGNYIGTAVNGAAVLGNGIDGILIGNAAHHNQIGGDTPGERNVISGNGDDGVAIDEANDNVVSGNYVGTDAGGTLTLGNADFGIVLVSGSQNNTIGGTTPGEGNLIAGSGRDGIYLASSVSNNMILGNAIGTDATGTLDLGNTWEGIELDAGAHDNIIGPGNRIAYNGSAGVLVDGDTTLANIITQNSIYTNTTLGIELSLGAHGNITIPVIITDTMTAGSLTIQGTACPGCTVEVFANEDTDGEGKYYLGSAIADGSGNFTLSMSSPAYPYLTATNTDSALGTSQFSAVYTATVLRRIYLPLLVR